MHDGRGDRLLRLVHLDPNFGTRQHRHPQATKIEPRHRRVAAGLLVVQRSAIASWWRGSVVGTRVRPGGVTTRRTIGFVVQRLAVGVDLCSRAVLAVFLAAPERHYEPPLVGSGTWGTRASPAPLKPPVEPWPAAPRSEPGNSLTSWNVACSTRWITSWAIRSPAASRTGSRGSRFTTITLISPRYPASIVPGALTRATPQRAASPDRGCTNAAYPSGSAMAMPVGSTARSPGANSAASVVTRSAPASPGYAYVGSPTSGCNRITSTGRSLTDSPRYVPHRCPDASTLRRGRHGRMR